jgi:hypothetical protein
VACLSSASALVLYAMLSSLTRFANSFKSAEYLLDRSTASCHSRPIGFKGGMRIGHFVLLTLFDVIP